MTNLGSKINDTAKKYIDNIADICKEKKPLVVISCLTYNHGAYLQDALEGFVKQKTDFPFVAIVHEDASTDNTADVLRKYAEKYPDIILPIFEKENQYSKGDQELNKVMRAAREATGAKYMAMCEGDDYWIDPLKLQKQVDFLEAHPDFGLVHTAVFESSWKDNFNKLSVEKRLVPEGNVSEEILRRNFIYTLSVMIRRELWEYVKKEVDPLPGFDRIIWICLSRHTKFHYIDEVMGTYRIMKNSATHGTNKQILLSHINMTNIILEYFNKNHFDKKDIDAFYLERCRILLKYSFSARDYDKMAVYWGKINELGSPTPRDLLLWNISKLKGSESMISGMKNIKRLLRKFTIG